MVSNSTSSQSPLTILLLGSGGREHAIAWKLGRSPSVGRLICAPGNPGIAACAELRQANIEDADEVVALARDVAADLVVIGPEAPLAAGVADALRTAGIATFGPSKAAARLEWDKAFSKEFMQRHSIPTAASETFAADQLQDALAYVRAHPLPVVIKANGLAAGKGVVIAGTYEEALTALDEMLSGRAFGESGTTVVLEQFMRGEEASVFAITDGRDYVLLAPSQDHKRVGDDDTGANTGGMGAYAPAPIVTDGMLRRIASTIVEPALRGMAEEGSPYIGCLYVGLMIDADDARVVEFNSRFGDPEAQVVLPLLDCDLAQLFLAAATGRVAEIGDVRSRGSAVCVVMASEGYPGTFTKGHTITGLEEAGALDGIVVFHAGTKQQGDEIVTNGGRVLGVTAISAGDDLEATIRRAYAAVDLIDFPGAHFRTDIGQKGVRE
jgi:phosphoribosylamine--glycine ligase